MKKHENKAKKAERQIDRRFFGVKKVVDNDGTLSCFLYKSKLYDLKYKEFAECKKIKKDGVNENASGKFVQRGSYIYKNGQRVGKIKSDMLNSVITVLLALLCLSIIALTAMTYEKKPPFSGELTIVDTNGGWVSEGELNIFGAKLIKPGDEGKYAFMVNNPSSVKLECKIVFKFKYENVDSLPPIKYSVSSAGETLPQEETENGFAVKDVIIDKLGSRAFYLEWEWPFDGGVDYDDTFAGFAGSKYILNIEINAEETK